MIVLYWILGIYIGTMVISWLSMRFVIKQNLSMLDDSDIMRLVMMMFVPILNIVISTGFIVLWFLDDPKRKKKFVARFFGISKTDLFVDKI